MTKIIERTREEEKKFKKSNNQKYYNEETDFKLSIWCPNSPDQSLAPSFASKICRRTFYIPFPLRTIGFPRKLKEQHPIKWSRGAMFVFRYAKRGWAVRGCIRAKYLESFETLRAIAVTATTSSPRRKLAATISTRTRCSIEPARDRRPGILIFLARGLEGNGKRPLYEKSRW